MSSANKRLARDFQLAVRDGKDENISVELVNENLFRWKAHFSFDKTSEFGQTLWSNGHKTVDLELVFREDYPQSAPFIRVLQPSLSGGYVVSHGALCMEALSQKGWSMSTNILNLLISVRGLMLSNNLTYTGHGGNSTEMEARMSYINVMNIHRWGAFVPKTKEEKKEEAGKKSSSSSASSTGEDDDSGDKESENEDDESKSEDENEDEPDEEKEPPKKKRK